MTQLLDDAADALERRLFFEEFTAGYEALRSDAVRWAEVGRERAVGEAADGDASR
jgi:hypothetical protein